MTDVLTPKQKLASSRAALLAAMGYRTLDNEAGSQTGALAKEQGRTRAAPRSRAQERFERSVLGRWWRRSHWSTVAEVGRPFLQHYASRHPAKLIAYAVGTGALIVLVKPWRLLSLGMILGALLRSTDVSGFLSDCLVPELGDTDHPRDDFLEQASR